MSSTSPSPAVTAADASRALSVDMKLEVVVLPVADVDRAVRFYTQLGWRLDADIRKGADFRVVQLTPPGSPCSIHCGIGLTSAAPGSMAGLYLVVSDIESARGVLLARGADVSDIFHRAPGEPDVRGVDPQRRTYSSFATFKDPDGNAWLLQEITTRLPGRIATDATSFASVRDLAAALTRAAAAHGQFEKRTGRAHADWPLWYADYLAKEQSGETLPT